MEATYTYRFRDDEYERPGLRLATGQEFCDCGRVREIGDRRKCAQCGHVGCPNCMQTAKTTVNNLEYEDTVCSDECETEWAAEVQKEQIGGI